MHTFHQTQIEVHCFELQLSAQLMPFFSFPLSIFYWYILPIYGFYKDIFFVANHVLDHIHYPFTRLPFRKIETHVLFLFSRQIHTYNCFYFMEVVILIRIRQYYFVTLI